MHATAVETETAVKVDVIPGNESATHFQLSRPEDVRPPLQVFEKVARLAYQRFLTRGWRSGNDREDWLEAASELLHTVPVEIEEQPEKIIVRVEVAGLEVSKLRASVEPWRVMIAGKQKDKWEFFYFDWLPPIGVYGAVCLPEEVVPELSTAKLLANTLEFSLQKTFSSQARTAGLSPKGC
jgi:HSP20 family molecular chaperone IbpA